MERPERPLIFFNHNELHRFMCDEIVYAEADGDYTHVFLTNGEEILLTKQLGVLWAEIVSQLPVESIPLSLAGRSLFINLDFVHLINPSKKILTLMDRKGNVYKPQKTPATALAQLKMYFESIVQKGGME